MTLRYGVHLMADTKSEMPLAAIVEPANVNEKKAAPTLLKKTIKRRRTRRVRHVVADSRYSSQAVRDEVKRLGAKPVIPYPRNQAKGRRVLRVDRRFCSHGPITLRSQEPIPKKISSGENRVETEDAFRASSTANPRPKKCSIACAPLPHSPTRKRVISHQARPPTQNTLTNPLHKIDMEKIV